MAYKNELVTLTIDDVTSDSNGVGRLNGMAVFVPYTAPGDVIAARIVKVQSRCCFGIIEEIVTPSPHRTHCTGCTVFGKCGGCSTRHIDYSEELVIKNNWVRENLKRIGKVDINMPPALASPLVDGYRNKAIYPISVVNGEIKTGFYAKRSHRMIAVERCALHPDFFANITHAFETWANDHLVSVYDEQTHQGLLRGLFIRYGEATGEVMTCIIANGNAIPHSDSLITVLTACCPAICSVILNTNTQDTNVLLGKDCITLFGSGAITDRLCDLDFSISPLSFYQVNRQGAQLLYGIATEFADLKKHERLLDLYCGTGTIGLSMAGSVKELVGVEIVPDAIENAKNNAKKNNITNAKFICADAVSAALKLKSDGFSPDVIILDPPRKGCEPALIKTAAELNPNRIVMISCDSATASRDVALFAELGYFPTRVQAVDMFPRTGHVELCLLLTRE